MKKTNNFKELIKNAEIDCEGGADYVIANDKTEDDFYFRYNFETEKVDFENSSKHELTGEEVEELILEMRAKFQEDIENSEPERDAFDTPDYYEEFGIDNGMFI